MIYTYKKQYEFFTHKPNPVSRHDCAWLIKQFGDPDTQQRNKRWDYKIATPTTFLEGYFTVIYSFSYQEDYVKFVLACG